MFQAHSKTRAVLAGDLAKAGQCVTDLVQKAILPQIQYSGMSTYPRKRILCSKDDYAAGSPRKRVRCDELGKNAGGHRTWANYSVGDDDAGDLRGHVRWSKRSKEADSYHGVFYHGNDTADRGGTNEADSWRQSYKGNKEAGSYHEVFYHSDDTADYKEAGNYHGVLYHSDDTVDRGGVNKADSYHTSAEHKANRPDGSNKNRGGHSGITARSRDGSNYWRSTNARADRDSGHCGGTHAYRHTSSERRCEVYIDRRKWVRSRNTKNYYGGNDRSSRHGGTQCHEDLKKSRCHDSRNGDSKRRDHSRSYDSDGSTRNSDPWHKDFAPPPRPPPLPARQTFSPYQPYANRQSGRQRDTDWIPRAYWNTIGKKTQEMVRKHGRSVRQRRRRGRDQVRRREAAVTVAAVEDVNHTNASTSSTNESVHRRRDDNRERGDVDRSDVEHYPSTRDHDDLGPSAQYDEVDYGGED